MISILENWRQNIRPTSTEYDPETSDAENEIEKLQLRYGRLKYKIKAGLKNSRKQEKVINQLKLKNEMLNKEKQKELQTIEERYNRIEMEQQRLENENQNYENDLKEKQKELQAFEERLNRLEIEKRKLESENQEYKDGWEVDQGIIQSHERENQKYKIDLQEKQKAPNISRTFQ